MVAPGDRHSCSASSSGDWKTQGKGKERWTWLDDGPPLEYLAKVRAKAGRPVWAKVRVRVKV